MFDFVAAATATLAASYLAAGFVHGVLNSDNINITGESFDYGPWRFTPDWDAEFIAAYFDHGGLYAFGRQPEAIHWDLAQLGGCLALIAEAPALADMLDGWPAPVRGMRWSRRWCGGWGSRPTRPSDRALLAAMLTVLRQAGDDDRPLLLRLARRARARRRRRQCLAGILDGRTARCPARSTHRLLVRRRTLLDAHRGGRGDLGGDCGARRLAPFEDKVAAIRRMGEAMAGTP